MLKKGQKLIDKVQNYKNWNFDSIFLTDESPRDKENSIWESKVQIRCLWILLNFIQGLIEFVGGLIARKLIF
jgi:hypothetical protein